MANTFYGLLVLLLMSFYCNCHGYYLGRYCPFVKNTGCSFAFDVFSFSIKLSTFLIYNTICLTLLKYNLKDQFSELFDYIEQNTMKA